MKAWQYLEDGAPIVLNDVPEPVLGPGDVLLEVKVLVSAIATSASWIEQSAASSPASRSR